MTGRSSCSRSSTILSQPRGQSLRWRRLAETRQVEGVNEISRVGQGLDRTDLLPGLRSERRPVQQDDGLPGLPALDEVMDLGPLHIEPARLNGHHGRFSSGKIMVRGGET